MNTKNYIVDAFERYILNIKDTLYNKISYRERLQEDLKYVNNQIEDLIKLQDVYNIELKQYKRFSDENK